MNIKKRSIISILLIMAMMFATAALTACNPSEEEVVEERTINIKIVGADNTVLTDMSVTIEDVPSAITVYEAISRICNIEGIDFVYDDDFKIINQIGIYGTPEEKAATMPTEVDEEGNITEIDDGSFWYWGYKVNGEEQAGSDIKEKTLNDGDTVLVEWLKDLGD